MSTVTSEWLWHIFGEGGWGCARPPLVILEDGAVDLIHVLFPHLAGIHVERVVVSGRSVRLEAATRGPSASCPNCGSSRAESAAGTSVGCPTAVCGWQAKPTSQVEFEHIG